MTLPKPSPEQQAILDLGLTTIKVRAGAGTGKTTTVAMVIANLVANHGIDPTQVVGLTFTNKAAAELADRVRAYIGESDPSRQAEIHTYHGFAAQLLSEFGVLAGLDSRLKVITPTFARQILSDVVYSGDLPEHLDISWKGRIDLIGTLADRLGDHLLTPDDLLAHEEEDSKASRARRDMAIILRRYEEEKRRLGVVDFSDLVRMAAMLMQDPAVADIVRNRYRVVVLDEYQDTNPAQRKLLQSLFGNRFPVIAVGDEDQTIYEWRGASMENFAAFEEHFTAPDGRRPVLRTLTLNRRSTPAILQVGNVVRKRANEDADDLVPALPDDPDGTVRTHWAQTALAEAEWVAARFEELHDRGLRWKDMAVLLRKNKDFRVVVEALARHDIPVEVANVGGLLSIPEVNDLVCWLKILERPDDSASLTTILMGSRFRLGLADLAILSNHVRARSEETESEDAEGNPVPVTLLEVVEDEVPGLRPDAAAALSDFRDMYRRILIESQGLSLVETCRLVLDVTGAWRDVEALPPVPRLTARLNLYRVLDLAQDWSPLQGRPSLEAFLDYLDTANEETSVDELDSARLSGEDAVTLLTVHRAKGLEWEAVAIPAVYEKNFPSSSTNYGNPMTTPAAVPIELRLDTVMAHLGPEEKAVTAFLTEAHLRQEWRTAYVAVTRARRHLFVTGAYWYGYPETLKDPRSPSPLWEEVNRITGDVPELPPPIDRPDLIRFESQATPDPVFPEGWDSAVRSTLRDPDWPDRLAEQRQIETEYRAAVAYMEERLFSLAETDPPAAVPETRPVSVTGLVTYAQCPKRFYWSEVDPLPRRLNPAAVRGTELHRRIELHQKGIIPLPIDDTPSYDAVAEDDWSPGAYDTYLRSRFADRQAALVEQPFNLEVGRTVIRGRIDAIYVEGDRWEIVDFKSGLPSDDPNRLVQLQAYAVAANDVDFGLPSPADLRVTFAYLGGGGHEETHVADRGWTERARDAVTGLVSGIESGAFEETPGTWCRHCDFVRFCPAGREFLGG